MLTDQLGIMEMKDQDTVVTEINNIAISLVNAHGATVDESTQCYLSNDCLISRCWNAAVVAYFNTVMRDSEDHDIRQYIRELLPVSAPPKLTVVRSSLTQ